MKYMAFSLTYEEAPDLGSSVSRGERSMNLQGVQTFGPSVLTLRCFLEQRLRRCLQSCRAVSLGSGMTELSTVSVRS
jgi:hypothetical protein